MSNTSFENYGRRAKLSSNFSEIAGRYRIQSNSERLIVLDIINKLKISPNDSILDIGSGVGTITIPVSFFCEKKQQLITQSA